MIPGDIETDVQPPLMIPLGHFLVALGFLLAAIAVGLTRGSVFTTSAGLAHVHLLLVGWVCVTIAGAMTQFVPVWSGVRLHSNRLATAQLVLLTIGLAGVATAFATDWYAALPYAGGLLLAGFWTLAYNIVRTLAGARPLDVTERHFGYALGFLLAVTTLGLALAIGFTAPGVLGGFDRPAVRGAHVALALFGVVLTTVFGALSQLVPMFAQSPFDEIDDRLQTVEEAAYPLGVLLLAAGRLTGHALAARVGGLLVVIGLLAVAAVLARRLAAASVEWGPMLRRYAVLPVSITCWAVWTLPHWLTHPLDPAVAFGAPGSFTLLAVGVIGFVVAGTLYHIVPFLVWVHRYSDRVGLEPVPMIDDLYNTPLARIDFVALVFGTTLLVASAVVSLPAFVFRLGGGLVAVGLTLFALNLFQVARIHALDTTTLSPDEANDPQ